MRLSPSQVVIAVLFTVTAVAKADASNETPRKPTQRVRGLNQIVMDLGGSSALDGDASHKRRADPKSPSSTTSDRAHVLLEKMAFGRGQSRLAKDFEDVFGKEDSVTGPADQDKMDLKRGGHKRYRGKGKKSSSPKAKKRSKASKYKMKGKKDSKESKNSKENKRKSKSGKGVTGTKQPSKKHHKRHNGGRGKKPHQKSKDRRTSEPSPGPTSSPSFSPSSAPTVSPVGTEQEEEFFLEDCASYNVVWLIDLADTCSDLVSLENCQCEHALKRIANGDIDCDASDGFVDTCPPSCTVCNTCLEDILGCVAPDT